MIQCINCFYPNGGQVFNTFKSTLQSLKIKDFVFFSDDFNQVKTMKIISVTLSLIFLLSYCTAQNRGKITCVTMAQKVGIGKLYIYQPPKNLLLPDMMEAVVIYKSKQQFYNKYIPVEKIGGKYQFLFKSPDFTSVLIIGMVDAKINYADYNALIAMRKKVIDNNNGAGFIFYLHNKLGKPFADGKIVLAELLSNYAAYYLNTKTENKLLLKMYQETYKLHPELTKEDSYMDYLKLLHDENEDAAKLPLLTYVRQAERAQNNEAKWMNAVKACALLKMGEEQQKLEHKILNTYPSGEFAKRKFWHNFFKIYKNAGDTEQSLSDDMNNYISRFNDSSDKAKDYFYGKINSLLFEKKEWAKIEKYEALVSDTFKITYDYDYFAWKLSGGQLDNEGTDLETAKNFSKKSIDYIKESIKKASTNDYEDLNMKGALNKYINTYALILYKLGQYDSAFYYEDGLYQQGNELNAAGIERYVAYAEKVEGVNYARQVLEQQLLKGFDSPILVSQLQGIYMQLNLPKNEFEVLQKKYSLLFKQKKAANVLSKLGSVKAKEFTLKNILGQQVSLSSLKNKIVVLDFWATWCGPCIASFPAMQLAINKYKDDSSVVFLFIDVWENTIPQKMKETVAKFMKDNNYSFNVLFDTENIVVNAYKIKGIPTKIVIDKLGNIVSFDDADNIEVAIEMARN